MHRTGKYLSLVVLAGAIIFGTCGAAFAANGEGDSDFGPPPFGPQLTKEQMDKAKKIFNDNYTEMDSTRKALTAKRAELDAQLASQTPDRAKIESLSREIGELRGKMLSARVAVRTQLEKEGLPTDFYGPNPYYAPPRNPGYMPMPGMMMGRPYHGGHHGGRGGWGGWRGGCGGCW